VKNVAPLSVLGFRQFLEDKQRIFSIGPSEKLDFS
jgi:hypothetical protein